MKNDTINAELLRKLGFELVRKYPHYQFVTMGYKKGHINVEITYEDDKQVNSEVVIEEFFCEPMTATELEIITPVLGKEK